MAELADGRGLSRTIDTDDHDHRRRCGQIQLHIIPHHITNDLLDQPHDLLRIGHTALLDKLSQTLADLHRGLHTHVTHDHGFLKLLEQILIDLRERIQNALHVVHHRVTGLLQTLLDF